MKKTIFNLKFLKITLILFSFIFTACVQDDSLEIETFDQNGEDNTEVIVETSSINRGIPNFGDTRRLVRGNPLPQFWLFSRHDSFLSSRQIVYTNGANFGDELEVANGQNLPFGWVRQRNAITSSSTVRIIYLIGNDIPFGTEQMVALGQSLPFNWVYNQTSTNPNFPGRAVYLGGAFLGDKATAALGQQLPIGWEYLSFGLAGAVVEIELISGPERPIPPISLFSGERLTPGQFRDSPNGQFRLWMQTDGNLVLYNTTNWQPLWYTGTNGKQVASLEMQGDGNLVLYDINWRPLWSSDTWRYAGATLSVQDDGNIVVYSRGIAAWHRLQD